MGTDWTLWLSLAVAALWLAGFAWVLLRRRCAKLRNGFTVELTLAVLTAGVVTALALGAWAYHEARGIVFDQLVRSLDNVGRTAEGELAGAVRVTSSKLSNLATPELLALARAKPEQARERLSLIMRFNPRFLQVDVFDAEGALLLSTTGDASHAAEAVNRVGAAYAVEGKPYVSEPYKSPAFGGRYILSIDVPVLDAARRPVGALGMRYDLQDAMDSLLSSVRLGETGHAVLLDPDGIALVHGGDGEERVGDDLSALPSFQAAARGETGRVVHDNAAGHPSLFVYRPVASPTTVNGRPLVMLSEIDLGEALAPVRTLHHGILAGAGLLVLVWVAMARPVARRLTKPLAELLAAAEKVGGGDLSAQARVNGRDEIGRFADAFNRMVQGLHERDRVKDVFGRYLTTQVSEKLLKNGPSLGGERKQVTMLFADIRDFTTLSESMTPEQVVEMLNDYFSEMVDAVFEQGGVLDKFIGDGMLAVFGSLDEQPDHRRRAVLAALRMKARLAKINGEREMSGRRPIHIGIGVHTDEVVVGNIGSRKRLEYTVIGDGVNTCARVESMNKEFGTTLLVTEQTRGPLGGEFECRELPETKVKGKAKPVKVYEVLSARATFPTNAAA